MNYLQQIKGFWIVAELHQLGHSEISLYFYLLEVWNKTTWAGQFKRQNTKVMGDLRIKSYKTLQSFRDKLAGAGILQFRQRNGDGNVEYQMADLGNFYQGSGHGEAEDGEELGKNYRGFGQGSGEGLGKGSGKDLGKIYRVKINPLKVNGNETETNTDANASGAAVAGAAAPVPDPPKQGKTSGRVKSGSRSPNPRSGAPPSPEPEVVLPWPDSLAFIGAWEGWKDYKKREHRFGYKSAHSEQAALKDLCELSEGEEEIALKIIKRCIAKGWKGLYPLDASNNRNGNQQSSTKAGTGTGVLNEDHKRDVADRLAKATGQSRQSSE